MDPVMPDPMTTLFSPGGADEPNAAYRELREWCPVARNEFAGTLNVSLSRYEDILWDMRHPEVFSSDPAAMARGEQPLIPLQVDSPFHPKYRRLLNPEFVPRVVGGIEPDVRMLVGRLINSFSERGECDFHEELATPLPSTIFLRLMGLPQSDLGMFPDADEVELGRDPDMHLAFGGGHHLCLGAHLAPLELRVGLEEFHRRIPEYRIADGAEIHFSPGIRQAELLPLVFDPVQVAG